MFPAREDTISTYVNQMSPELYDALSGGSDAFLREHTTFPEDIHKALEKLEKLL